MNARIWCRRKPDLVATVSIIQMTAVYRYIIITNNKHAQYYCLLELELFADDKRTNKDEQR